eukprot:1377380-Amorphochlora_amoeboformis.AAC.1
MYNNTFTITAYTHIHIKYTYLELRRIYIHPVQVRHGEYKRIAVRVHCEYQNGEDRHLGLLAKGIRFFMNNAAAPYLSTSDYSAAMASMPTECPFVVEEFAWH